MNGIGIISGNGALPRILAEECRAKDRAHLVIDFEGITVDWAENFPKFTASFEQPETMFEALRNAGCNTVVMAGSMQRPALDPSKFDQTFAGIAVELMGALKQGDDAGLTVVLKMIENAGFTVLPAHEVAASLLQTEGVLTNVMPSILDKSDAERAHKLVLELGRLDVGQGAVVADGLCLGLETLQGTKALLSFVSGTEMELRPKETKGLYYKAPKEIQDRRVDLPAIGPDTVDQVVGAGLGGIVIEAGGVLVIDRDTVVQKANDAGLFIWSRTPTL